MTVQTPMPEDIQNRTLGLAAALGVLVIWSGFIVFSRAGVQTALTPATSPRCASW